MIQVSQAFITRKPFMVLLDILDTHMSSIQVLDPAFKVYRQMVHYYYRLSLFTCIFLFTRTCVQPINGARLFRSLWDFRRRIPKKRSHSLDYSLGLFGAIGLEVIFIEDFESCGPHVAFLCGIAVYIVVYFGLTYGTGLQHHHHHSLSAQFDSQSFIVIFSHLPLRGISHHYES